MIYKYTYSIRTLKLTLNGLTPSNSYMEASLYGLSALKKGMYFILQTVSYIQIEHFIIKSRKIYLDIETWNTCTT